MKIHHLRNATLIVEAAEFFILVDPMLGAKGTFTPFSFFRYKPKKNPLVDLPASASSLLKKITHCLITHQHLDHLDKEGIHFLKEKNIPVSCNFKDDSDLSKHRLNIQSVLKPWDAQDYLGGKIIGIPAKHGYGWVHKPMGNVMGFFLALPNCPSIYISADTIYTNEVEKVFKTLRPDISVVASGVARLDIGQPLLMTIDDIIRFVKRSPKKVIANHLEALNHCPTTRKYLKEILKNKGLLSKVFIPEDGETIVF
ncbi:MAG: MBL fold metallo-hydrolase [Flavobacteriaceae bacterium]|nr:MBL fold metallo-hydrolase [Flavobacteriaceae bacterium]